MKDYNQNWSWIPDQLYTTLITGGSGSRKTNTLINLIKQQDGDDLVSLIKFIYVLKMQMNQISTSQ